MNQSFKPGPTACLLALSLLMAGCVKQPESPRTLSLGTVVEEPAVKSQLPSDSVWENRISEVSIFCYDLRRGRLDQAVYVQGNTATLSCRQDADVRVYVLANMGDLRSMAPLLPSQVASLRIPVPSMTEMAGKGIPMCGSALVMGGTSQLEVPLRRLLARLEISLDAEMDIAPDGLYVRGAASALYPFRSGGSAVAGSADISSAGDQVLFPALAPYILYVPENRQGDLLDEGTDSWDKSLSNPRLDGSRCTYLELTAVKQGSDGIEGALTYRFYPGANPSCNFDLIGGKNYQISLSLTWNGMFVDGNWKVTRGNWNDRRALLVSLSPEGPFTESLSLSLAAGASTTCYVRCAAPGGNHQAGGFRLTEQDGLGAHLSTALSGCTPLELSVPYSLALPGSRKSLELQTREGLLSAGISVDILSPPSSFSFDDDTALGTGVNTY